MENNTESTLTIPITMCNSWFMEKLGKCQRNKIREYYRLNESTLKITDEMLKDIYEKEMSKPKWERLLENYYYKYI